MRVRFLLKVILLAMLSPITAAALAETLGDARVGFSAERVLVIDGQNYSGKMWHMPGEQRHEQALSALRDALGAATGSLKDLRIIRRRPDRTSTGAACR